VSDPRLKNLHPGESPVSYLTERRSPEPKGPPPTEPSAQALTIGVTEGAIGEGKVAVGQTHGPSGSPSRPSAMAQGSGSIGGGGPKAPSTASGVPIKHIPAKGRPPSQRMTVKSERHELAELGESVETKAMHETGLTGAGMARNPRHHVFPKEHKPFFNDRGFSNIDDYCVELEGATHEGIHGGGDYKLGRRVWKEGEWNSLMMETLETREAQLGRKLTKLEIIDEGKQLMARYRIDKDFVNYHAPRGE
jgi:hypothetical protein